MPAAETARMSVLRIFFLSRLLALRELMSEKNLARFDEKKTCKLFQAQNTLLSL